MAADPFEREGQCKQAGVVWIAAQGPAVPHTIRSHLPAWQPSNPDVNSAARSIEGLERGWPAPLASRVRGPTWRSTRRCASATLVPTPASISAVMPAGASQKVWAVGDALCSASMLLPGGGKHGTPPHPCAARLRSGPAPRLRTWQLTAPSVPDCAAYPCPAPLSYRTVPYRTRVLGVVVQYWVVGHHQLIQQLPAVAVQQRHPRQLKPLRSGGEAGSEACAARVHARHGARLACQAWGPGCRPQCPPAGNSGPGRRPQSRPAACQAPGGSVGGAPEL